MIFLTPIPAVLAAAVTVPALLVLYFLKLRRRPVRVGSTMLWAQAAEDLQANVPFKWLRPSLLLLLQLLILSSFLVALARPAVRSSGDMPGQVFVLVDRSASMRAADLPDGRTRFDEASLRARRVIERTSVGSFAGEVTVVGFASGAEIVAGPTRSRGELLRAVDAMTPTDQPGDLGGALRLVQALLAPAAGDEVEVGARPLVIVCSDGSVGGELPAIAADVRFERAAPERSGINLGVVAMAARRDAKTPSLVRAFARLVSTDPEPVTLGIALRHDGVVVARQTVELAPASAESGAGQTPLTLELNVPAGGLLTLVLERDDVLPADDEASVVIAPPRRPHVLLVRREESEQAGSGWLLTDVLRELELGSLTLISSDRLAELGAEAYRGVDLAIFDGAPSPGIPPVASVHFGEPPALPGLVASPGASGVLPVLSWRRTDPLLRDLSLDAVRVGRTMLLTPSPDAGPGAFTELARTSEGVVLARVEHQRVPHVVAGFELMQSTWPLDAGFPVLLALAVETLPVGGSGASGWSATTAAPVTLPGGDGGVLRDPEGRTRPVEGSRDALRLGVLDRAGVWSIGDRAIPVNLFDERESSLEAPTLLPTPGGAVEAGAKGVGLGEPREVWEWFVMLAAALLAAEWVLYALRVRV